MKKSNGHFLQAAFAVVVFTFISHNQPAFAGWTGLINGAGTGWASVNVRSSTLQTNRLTTVNNLLFPSAAMAPTTGYKTNAPLPEGASTNTYSRIKGLSGGIWQAATRAAIGDGTDNLELQNRVTIIPADCASLTFDSIINQTQEEFSSNGNSGTITVNAKATAGTALWLRGFEYTGSMDDLPSDNPDTVENESIEYLKAHGVWKFETLILGPFDFGGLNCPLIVPFTLSSSNLENLIFVADGAALSLPLVVVCPPDVVVKCEESFTYPPVQYAGCGNITIAYNPPLPPGGSFPAGAFPVGVTPVTVTATDSDGHTTNCTFTVTVTDTTPPVAPALPIVTGGCSTPVTLTAPTTTDNCGGIVTGTTTTVFPITTVGTTVVTWTFNDGNGNTSTANQTVIVTGLTFDGFFAPINGTGGTCQTPLRTANLGNNLPVKFKVSCNGSPIMSGRPTIALQQCSGGSYAGTGNFVMVGNEWHFNWDTSGRSKGVYELITTLQDGSTRNVFIRLK